MTLDERVKEIAKLNRERTAGEWFVALGGIEDNFDFSVVDYIENKNDLHFIHKAPEMAQLIEDLSTELKQKDAVIAERDKRIDKLTKGLQAIITHQENVAVHTLGNIASLRSNSTWNVAHQTLTK